MKCSFDIKYLCQNCGRQHSTYTQYEREFAVPPSTWVQYNEGRQHSEDADFVGATYTCEEVDKYETKVQNLQELFVWPLA